MAPRFGHLPVCAAPARRCAASQIVRDCCEQVRLARRARLRTTSPPVSTSSRSPSRCCRPCPCSRASPPKRGEMRVLLRHPPAHAAQPGGGRGERGHARRHHRRALRARPRARLPAGGERCIRPARASGCACSSRSSTSCDGCSRARRDRGGARLPAERAAARTAADAAFRGRRSGSPPTTTRPSCGRPAWPTPGCSTRTRSSYELERQLGLYHAERERCGLAPAGEIPIIKELLRRQRRRSAMRAVRPYLEDKYKAYVQWGQSEVLPEGDTLRQAFEQLAEGGRFIVGGPETCARQVREHVERLGATTFLFRFQWPGMPQELVLASMRRAAERSSRWSLARRPRSPPRRARPAARSRPRPRQRGAGSAVSASPRPAQAVEHGRRGHVGDREAPAAGPRRGVVEQALESLELGQRGREGAAAAVGVGRLGAEPPARRGGRRPPARSGKSAGRRNVAMASSSQLTVARSGRSEG